MARGRNAMALECKAQRVGLGELRRLCGTIDNGASA